MANVPQMLCVLAQSLSEPDFTIAGYPEYGTDLDAGQRNELEKVAMAIARSQAGFNPVVAAIIIGNADKALRKAISERAAFEFDVSQHRATAAANSLVQGLIKQSFDAHYARTFRTFAIGVGNANAIFVNASNETEMRQNRRVEFYLVTVHVGAPSCGTV